MKPRDTSNIDWHSLFVYDTTSPSCLRWKTDRHKIKAGAVAGYETPTTERKTIPYYMVAYSNTQYLAHRVIFEMFNGPIKDENTIDHLNGNGLDNRIENLDAKPKRSNLHNQRKYRNNTSGVTGVCRYSRKNILYDRTYYWQAQWYDLDGKKMRKNFNINKLGNDEAFSQAKQYRENMINELRAQGLNYTERHGT